jgi:hypothetical protein
MTRGDDVLFRRDGQISYEDEPGVSATSAVSMRASIDGATKKSQHASGALTSPPTRTTNTMGTMKHEAPPTVMVARGYDFLTVGR